MLAGGTGTYQIGFDLGVLAVTTIILVLIGAVMYPRVV